MLSRSQHLGWIVVWGNIFGAIFGIIARASNYAALMP